MTNSRRKTLTLNAIRLLSLLATGGCANVSPPLTPHFGLVIEGPGYASAYSRSPDNSHCVHNFKCSLEGSSCNSTEQSPPKFTRLCAGSFGETGIPWPPQVLTVGWQATPSGPVIHRTIELPTLVGQRLKGGNLVIRVLNDRLQLWLQEPDMTKPVAGGGERVGVYSKKAPVLIYEAKD